MRQAAYRHTSRTSARACRTGHRLTAKNSAAPRAFPHPGTSAAQMCGGCASVSRTSITGSRCSPCTTRREERVNSEVGMHVEHLRHDVRSHGSSFSVAQARDWIQGVLACGRRTLCAIRGHDLLLHLETCRLSLRCVDCGWESSGWLIERPRLRTYAAQRPRLAARRTGKGPS